MLRFNNWEKQNGRGETQSWSEEFKNVDERKLKMENKNMNAGMPLQATSPLELCRSQRDSAYATANRMGVGMSNLFAAICKQSRTSVAFCAATRAHRTLSRKIDVSMRFILLVRCWKHFQVTFAPHHNSIVTASLLPITRHLCWSVVRKLFSMTENPL